MTDKKICSMLDLQPSTFSRWKSERPELYQRIKESYECEATLKKLGVSLDEAKAIIELYKTKKGAKGGRE